MPVTSYSTIAANNNGAPPNGAPEGMAPSGVNDTIRQLMADTAREAQINAVKKLTSVTGTNTIVADMDPELLSYAAGMLLVLIPANTNTSAVTLSIDTLTALDIVKDAGGALVAGDLVVGVPALLLLDDGADDFYLLNPQPRYSSGTYTPTATNVTNVNSSSVSTSQWMRVGNTVNVSGYVTGTALGAGAVEVGISLPITSAISAVEQVSGVAVSTGDFGVITGDVANDRAAFLFISGAGGSFINKYIYTYLIV